MILLNNQHLGMVVQWEDRFHAGNRAHTYLGPIDHPEATGEGDGDLPDVTYPDFVTIAKGFGIAARQIRKKSEVIDALKEMIAHHGPYVLERSGPLPGARPADDPGGRDVSGHHQELRGEDEAHALPRNDRAQLPHRPAEPRPHPRAHQQLTREWWDLRRSDFELFVSQAVIEEVSGGDPVAAAERMKVPDGLPVLDISDDAKELTGDLISSASLPGKATVDALHIALSALNGMDYLLTWNCTHIANVTLRGKIESVIRSHGFDPPLICTPGQLLEV